MRIVSHRTEIRLPFCRSCKARLSHAKRRDYWFLLKWGVGDIIRRRTHSPIPIHNVASAQELSDFLQSVEKRAFKRSLYHVRDEDAALDIVQDSMMKLAEHYADKPVGELPMLFQRILANTTLDWFRRNKTRSALFSNFSEFEGADSDDDFDLLSFLGNQSQSDPSPSAEDGFASAASVRDIEEEIQKLPARQREAFLLRYWEDMDVAETASIMGCSEGSVKTHCSRAVQALGKALIARGYKP
jgi:RNA polymerase sigma-70 factor (ECF subfamily)